MPPIRRHFQEARLLALSVLALLVSDTAAGLASRLARGLALAAAALLCAFAKVTSFNSFDMFHSKKPPNILMTYYNTVFIKSQ